jgi:hypothetical protein
MVFFTPKENYNSMPFVTLAGLAALMIVTPPLDLQFSLVLALSIGVPRSKPLGHDLALKLNISLLL